MEKAAMRRFYPVPVLGLTVALGGWCWLTFSGQLRGLDEALLLWFRLPGDPATTVGPSWLTNLVTGVTHVGDSIFLIILSVAVIGWLFRRDQKAEALTLLGAACGAFVMTPLLKALFGRMRPDIVDHLVHASSASFPSGHTLRSAVVYLAIFFVLRRAVNISGMARLFPFVLLLVGAIGSSRVFLGVHWPSDIIAGWLIAGLWIALWWPRLRANGQKT